MNMRGDLLFCLKEFESQGKKAVVVFLWMKVRGAVTLSQAKMAEAVRTKDFPFHETKAANFEAEV